MRDLSLNPHEIVQALEDHLHSLLGGDMGKPRVAAATKDVMKLAFHHASRAGRQLIESSDLFVALFEESRGPVSSVPVAIIRQHGVEPDALVSKIAKIGRASCRERG